MLLDGRHFPRVGPFSEQGARDLLRVVPVAARRVRQLPRLVVGAIVVAVVLFGIGLLIGGTLGSTHTTELRTVTAIVKQESPVQAAQLRSASTTIAAQSTTIAAQSTTIAADSTTIAADSTAIVALGGRLAATQRRLARARHTLRVERRRLAALRHRRKR